jgi:hypothetical protein
MRLRVSVLSALHLPTLCSPAATTATAATASGLYEG